MMTQREIDDLHATAQDATGDGCKRLQAVCALIDAGFPPESIEVEYQKFDKLMAALASLSDEG